MTNGKSGTAASRPSPVDGDRLWCDRIRNETVSAKNWNETYEYLINRNLQSDSERQAELERQLGASGFCYSGMKSESQASYGSRPPLERGTGSNGLRSTCAKFK